ncbi:MAG: hypothetical protein ABI852_17125, partial [Gemmatimonadaceae bacterium]
MPDNASANNDDYRQVGPDKPAAESAVRVFPCKNCGAALHFAPGVGKLTCATCGTVNDLPAFDDAAMAAAHEELDYRSAIALKQGNESAIDVQVVDCPQCG